MNKILFGGGVFIDLARGVIFLSIILILINTFWITIFIVDGASMEPYLHDGEVVLLGKNSYVGEREPERGDVVVVQYPGDPEHKRYVKRVIGLPNDQVEVRDGKVYLNNTLVRESYLPIGTITDQSGDWKIEKNQYFLMGDNRIASNDSRYFGPVEKRFFVGKALAIIYPRAKTLKDL